MFLAHQFRAKRIFQRFPNRHMDAAKNENDAEQPNRHRRGHNQQSHPRRQSVTEREHELFFETIREQPAAYANPA